MSSVMACFNSNPSSSQKNKFEVTKFLTELDNSPPSYQLAAGGCGGLVCGYFTAKVGKWVALTAGGALLALQYANQKGYVKVDWSAINREVKKAYTRIEQNLVEESQESAVNKAANILSKHSYIAGGFVAGYLIGFGCA